MYGTEQTGGREKSYAVNFSISKGETHENN